MQDHLPAERCQGRAPYFSVRDWHHCGIGKSVLELLLSSNTIFPDIHFTAFQIKLFC